MWQRLLDPDAFVFIDEPAPAQRWPGSTAGAEGRARGRRRAARPPARHHLRLRPHDGRPRRAARPVGADAGPAFLAYTEQFLAPSLHHGSVVVPDNLAAQKVAGVRKAVAAAGGKVMSPPPYSPDLNPIEQASAKLKTVLRRRRARTPATTLGTSSASCSTGSVPASADTVSSTPSISGHKEKAASGRRIDLAPWWLMGRCHVRGGDGIELGRSIDTVTRLAAGSSLVATGRPGAASHPPSSPGVIYPKPLQGLRTTTVCRWVPL
ncbi:transposase [Acuticoccus sp.]|uniref:transposase n=1 Tax=Acuticoccus sp. TaxID=1904378 RepID=UPI003B528CA7